jgi:secreted trypsin-like serine protease
LSAANIEVMDPVTDRTIIGGTPINIMGWGLAGNDSENLELPRILQEASHTLVDQNTCEQELTVAPYDRSIMYCVGNPLNQNSPTPCYGDSGSPMTTKVGNKEKIIGIASWGDRPCYYQEYLAYTRAATYYDWIYANHEYPLFVKKKPASFC